MASDDSGKRFTHRGVTVARYDYESMPCPMAASLLDDAAMQKVAELTYRLVSDRGWTDDEIRRYLGDVDDWEDSDMPCDMIRSEYWRCMEAAAIGCGMKYYEDIQEECKKGRQE